MERDKASRVVNKEEGTYTAAKNPSSGMGRARGRKRVNYKGVETLASDGDPSYYKKKAKKKAITTRDKRPWRKQEPKSNFFLKNY